MGWRCSEECRYSCTLRQMSHWTADSVTAPEGMLLVDHELCLSYCLPIINFTDIKQTGQNNWATFPYALHCHCKCTFIPSCNNFIIFKNSYFLN